MTESENENDHFDLDHFDHVFIGSLCFQKVQEIFGCFCFFCYLCALKIYKWSKRYADEAINLDFVVLLLNDNHLCSGISRCGN